MGKLLLVGQTLFYAGMALPTYVVWIGLYTVQKPLLSLLTASSHAAMPPTIDAVQQNLPATTNMLAGLKSPADELLDELARAFPIVFSGTVVLAFGFQYVKETIKREELNIPLPELPENAGTLFVYSLLLLPIAGIFLVFANDAGLPVPSPDKVLSPVTYVLNTGMGITAKTSMDVWNTIAPVIGLGQAKLNY